MIIFQEQLIEIIYPHFLNYSSVNLKCEKYEKSTGTGVYFWDFDIFWQRPHPGVVTYHYP